MSKNEKLMKDNLSEEDVNKVSGGKIFEVKCSGCGKKIHYADHRWGEIPYGSATLCKGYFCNGCVEKFRAGEIKNKDLLDKFNQLDDRGDPDRYKRY